ncbi:MAG TPA: hypothetical protein PLE55_11995, partial [Clostridiales bacterium]|nr:hypothetical protein [Clostridiales bacterium]
MKKYSMKAVIALLCAALLLTPFLFTAAAADTDIAAAKESALKIAAWLKTNAAIPQSGEIDGNVDWTAFACA